MAAAGAMGAHIPGITRVQKPPLWDTYTTQRGIMQRKYAHGLRSGAVRLCDPVQGAGPVIVQRLWNGSCQTVPHELARSGLGVCASYRCNTVLYGQGNYFAQQVWLATAHYAHRLIDGTAQVALAGVLIGAYGEAVQGALRPPPTSVTPVAPVP